MLHIMSAKDVRRVLDAEIAKQKKNCEAVKIEVKDMFARRAAARYLFIDRWGRNGYAYSEK